MSKAATAAVTATATIEHGIITDRVRVRGQRYAVQRYGNVPVYGPTLADRRGKRRGPIFRKSGAPRDYRVFNQGAIQICISMPPDDFAKLADLVRRERKNRSQVIRDLVLAHHASLEWKTP